MRVWGAAVVVVVAAIVLPVIFGAPAEFNDRSGGDAWRNVIYDFQTLITGALAVAAALGTIYQMRASDALQERRHREIRHDARKGDEFAVGRLRAFLPKAAREHVITFRAYSSAEDPLGNAIEWHHAKFEAERFRGELQDSRLTSCLHLLPPEIFQALEDCRRDVETMLRIAQSRAENDLSQPHAMERDNMFDELAVDTMCKLEIDADRLADLIDQWALDFVVDPEHRHLKFLTL
jgi:hypothetical protein